MNIYNRQNNKKESTLNGYSKKELVEYCLILQSNLIQVQEGLDQQYINAQNIYRDMDIFNKKYKELKEKGVE